MTSSRNYSRAVFIFIICISVLCAFITLQRPAPETPETPTSRNTLYHLITQAQANGWQARDYVLIGNEYDRMGYSQRAIPFWQTSLALQPSINLSNRVVRLLLQSGEWVQALQLIQRTLQTYPDDADMNARAGFLLAPSNPQEALVYLRKANNPVAQEIQKLIAEDIPEPAYSLRVGSLLGNAGYYAEAEAAFVYASAFNYPYPEAMAQVGFMRDLQNKYGADWIAQAVAFAPDSPPVRFIQALHLRAVGEPELALDAFQKLLQLQPANAVIFNEIALTYDKIGLTDVANEWREQAQSLPTTP